MSRNPPKRTARPLDAARLDEFALSYVARFATTRAKLGAYLVRKLGERGWAGEGEPPVAAIVERLAGAGYVDDAAYARAKSGSLLRRGYGQRRVDQALGAAGIADEVRLEVRPSDRAQRRAALALARKRGFGPFAAGSREDASFARAQPDRAPREKQIAAMLRAGHSLDSARELVDAPSAEAAEAWADEDEVEH